MLSFAYGAAPEDLLAMPGYKGHGRACKPSNGVYRCRFGSSILGNDVHNCAVYAHSSIQAIARVR